MGPCTANKLITCAPIFEQPMCPFNDLNTTEWYFIRVSCQFIAFEEIIDPHLVGFKLMTSWPEVQCFKAIELDSLMQMSEVGYVNRSYA